MVSVLMEKSKSAAQSCRGSTFCDDSLGEDVAGKNSPNTMLTWAFAIDGVCLFTYVYICIYAYMYIYIYTCFRMYVYHTV